MVNPWKFLGVKKLHAYLCGKFDIYRKWHWHPHHQKVHWATLVFNITILFLIIALSFAPFHSQKTQADATAISVSPVGYTNVDSFTFTLTGDPIVGAVKYQYRTGSDPDSSWYDYNPALSDTITIPNLDHPSGLYKVGQNDFYFIALDSGNNVIANLSAYYYYCTTPSQPQNVTANPEYNESNSFTFEWDPPESFLGNGEDIIYYYSINAFPDEYNTNSTSGLSVGPSSFATKVGINRFFVVAKDGAGNIDYENYNMVEFEADTAAPPAPTSPTINDISNRETSQYRLVVGWTPPTITDPGNFKGYDVYSSTSESAPFTKIATTSENAYVQTSLTKDATYYYYVRAVDKTGNESAGSSTISAQAVGRYTRAPNVTKIPVVSAGSQTASINWVTEREATSYIEYGKTSALGQSTGNGPTRYVTDHAVALTSLEPGTTYYYKTVFTDSDGNTGQTAVTTFTTLAAPTITNIEISDIGTTSLTVSFETSIPSHGEVDYGTTPNYDSKVAEENAFITKHSVKINGLTDGSKYYIGIKQTDAEGNTFTPNTYEVSTLPKPKILDLKVQGEKNIDNPAISIEYTTNIDTTTYVKYTPEGGETKEYSSMTYAKNHSVKLENLTALKLYTLEIGGNDKSGNVMEAKTEKFTTLSDTMPPKILNMTAKKKVIGEGTNAIAVLTIKMTTNEPSAVIIEASQGIDTKSFSIVSTEDPLNTEHTVELKIGKPGVPYAYHIKMADYSGNETVTQAKTFVATAANQGVLGFITDAFTRSFGWLGKFIKL